MRFDGMELISPKFGDYEKMEEAVKILIDNGHDEDDAWVIAEAMRDCFVE